MKEQDYQSKIIKRLEAEGYYCLKLIKTNKNGIPDIVALKPDEVVFIECKLPNGKLSELQKYRIEELNNKGFKAFVSYGNEIKDFPNQLDKDEF